MTSRSPLTYSNWPQTIMPVVSVYANTSVTVYSDGTLQVFDGDWLWEYVWSYGDWREA